MSLGLLAAAADCALIGGVVAPYLFATRSWRTARDTASFSKATSAVILVSQTLRVFFYFALPVAARFRTALLLQSLAAIAGQLYVLRVLLRVQRVPHPGAALRPARAERSILDCRSRDVGHWTDFESWVLFLGGLVVVLSSATTAAVGTPSASAYAGALGWLALGLEALLPVPQLLLNWKRRSTTGVSSVIIATWACGDAAKVVYAISLSQPLQFLLCGVFQIAVDAAILAQMVVWRGGGADASGDDDDVSVSGH